MENLKNRIIKKFFENYYIEKKHSKKKFYRCCDQSQFIFLNIEKTPFDYGYIPQVQMGYCGGLGYTAYEVYDPEPQHDILVDKELIETQFLIKCQNCGKQWEVEVSSKEELESALQRDLDELRNADISEKQYKDEKYYLKYLFKQQKSKLNDFGELIDFSILS